MVKSKDITASSAAAIEVSKEWRQIPLHHAPRPEGFVPLDFRGKKILAPMVRVGTLPMRLLSLEHGAGKDLHMCLLQSL
jgi:hypothetical protein